LLASVRRLSGYVLVAVAAILWGTEGIAVTYVLMGGMDQLTAITLMTAIAAIVTCLYAGSKGVRNIRVDLLAYGALVVTAFRSLYALSITINGAGITASLLYTSPLLVAVIAPLTIREKPSVTDIALATIAVIGAYISSNPSLEPTSIQGFLVGIALATDYAIATVAIKYFYGKGYSREEVMIQPTLAAVPALATLSAIQGPKIVLNNTIIPALIWGGAVAIGVALIAYTEGMKYVKALEASVIATLEPVSALLLASYFLGERYVTIQVAGIALILTSAAAVMLKNCIRYY